MHSLSLKSSCHRKLTHSYMDRSGDLRRKRATAAGRFEGKHAGQCPQVGQTQGQAELQDHRQIRSEDDAGEETLVTFVQEQADVIDREILYGERTQGNERRG